MPVIINELEVVTEPPQAPPSAGQSDTGPAAAAGAPPAVTPPDVEAIVDHLGERASRVYAA